MKKEDLAITLSAIIEAAIDGIITIDDKGIVLSLNTAAANYFGYNSEDVIGQNIKILMPDPYHSEHDGYIDRYNKTRQAKIIGIGREVQGRKKNGTVFPFRLAVSEVILNDRIIFAGIIHDLSDVKTAEKKLVVLNQELETMVAERTEELEEVVNKLLETNDELKKNKKELDLALSKEKELNELKSRFVSMASHEFRTPLATILSSASLISKYKELSQDEKREKHIGRIKSAVVNLTGILNDFLSLSKIEEGKVVRNMKSFDIAQLCTYIIEEIQGIKKKGQSINLNIIEGIQVHSDEQIIKNIVFNVLSNAIKYSGENSTVWLDILTNTKEIELRIKDEGIGIPEGEQKYLFERFFRASNVENIQGTGLGLSIVKRYCQLIDADISFESHSGQGTTFFIRIPNV